MEAKVAKGCPLVLLLLAAILSGSGGVAGAKYSQRVFTNDRAIASVDPTHDGFRVLLEDAFIERHLQPTLLPTLLLTAIPLEGSERGAGVTNVVYADSPLTGKQLTVTGLRARAWHYVCVEFENFSRQNETAGSECQFHRTLDFGAPAVPSTVLHTQLIDATSQSLAFAVRTEGDFLRRLTFSLRNGQAATPGAETFIVDASSDLDLKFGQLKPDKLYGQLCVLEEPLVEALSAMGRRIAGIRQEHCQFGKLRTRDYDYSVFESEASPYSAATTPYTSHAGALFMLAALLAHWLLRYEA